MPTKLFYKIMAMSVNKKLLLDQNVHDNNLICALNSVGIRHVKDISWLGFNKEASTKDSEIARKLSVLSRRTPNSGYLFITRNYNDFPNPKGYDVLEIPQNINIRDFVESFKQWLTLMPNNKSQNKIYRAIKSRQKGTTPYVFETINHDKNI